MRRAPALALVLASACASATAYAHGGLPISQRILRQGGGDTMYVPVDYWGLWIGPSGGPWKWICEEMINAYRFRKFAISTDGALYTTNQTGLTQSSDHGCTWTAATGAIANVRISDLAVDPVDGATAWATGGNGATADGDGSVTLSSNAVWVTHDHGASWSPLTSLATQSDRLFATLRVAASDPRTIYVTSSPQTAPFVPQLHRSSDGGMNFETVDLTTQVGGSVPYALELLAIDPRNPAVVWARGVNDVGTSTAPDPRHALLRSADRGDHWVDLLDIPATLEPSGLTRGIDDVAIDVAGSSVYVAVSQQSLTSSPGGVYAGSDSGDATAPLLARRNALDVAQCVDVHGGALYACSSEFEPNRPAAVARSDDGAQTYSTALDYTKTVGPVDCPKGTPVGDNCPTYWYTYGAQLGISFGGDGGALDATVTPPESPRAGCSCDVGALAGATGGGAALAFLLLVLAARLARRRG